MADRVIVLDRGELLAEGALDEFTSSGARGRVSYSVTLLGYDLSLQGLLASQPWAGEMRVRMDGPKAELDIDSTGLESGLLRLLLSDPSVTVLDFRKREEGLEELFLRLMRGRDSGE